METKRCKVCDSQVFVSRKELRCRGCGEYFCGRHIYSYVDGNNGAITRHAPNFCETCYLAWYKKDHYSNNEPLGED